MPSTPSLATLDTTKASAAERRSADPGDRRATAWAGLIWTLVRTDFKARYHGTLSGFVWALLKPLTMFVVLTAVFSLVFHSDPTYKLDLLIGLFLWDFFAETTKTGLTSLHAKGFLLSKARFPSWIVVVTSISNPLITIAVFCMIVLGFLTITGNPPSLAGYALFVGYVLVMGVLGVGVSLAGSVLFLRYRDLNQIWDVAIQAGFFIAPIIYPMGVIPERFHFYLYLWPPTAVIEFSRAVLVDQRLPSLAANLSLFLVAVLVLGLGLAVYRRLAPRAPEYSVMAAPVIELRGVSKTFAIPSIRRTTVREHIFGVFERARVDRLRALQDVDLALLPGETLGIMGRNGCGKSTLLKVLSGVYTADTGTVVRTRDITPILELGVGWNTELDAIDNVYLVGSVLGLSLREIRRDLDEILAFAELERFAGLRLKFYSSGMASRLAYAVAFRAVRDILVLDEIFAVGDAGFRAKCEVRYRELHEAGHSVLLVSHDPRVVETYCTRAILMDAGRIVAEGTGAEIVRQYLARTGAEPVPVDA